eukprot:14751891-Heterocapsa_arctica.AAC.1
MTKNVPLRKHSATMNRATAMFSVPSISLKSVLNPSGLLAVLLPPFWTQKPHQQLHGGPSHRT